MAGYRFPTRDEPAQPVRTPELEIIPFEREEQRGFIGSRLAASFAEWIFALALWRLKIGFIYKHRVRGTRFIVDFYLDAAPERIPVDVRQYARYVETGYMRFRQKIIERATGRRLRVVYDIEIPTVTDAVRVARRIVS